jgi:hypothetical protein
MRRAIVLALLAAATPAGAQPAMPRPTCAVSIVRAPDDVRGVVEDWVHAEPRCNTRLEVRIVPTEGGLYLLARDGAGHVRERVVPDAQSAGVLVASWVAADSSPPQPAPPQPAAVPPSAMLGSEGLLAPGEGGAPGTAPVIGEPAPTRPPRWLSLGALVAMSGTGGGGIRGELDLLRRGILSFGVAASASQSGMTVYGSSYEEMGTLDTFDGKAVGYIALDGSFGRWRLRSAFGAGLVYTRAQLEQPGIFTYREADGVVPAGEASLTLGRELGAHWAIDVGPIVSLYVQEYEIENSGDFFSSRTLQRRDLEAMFFLGVRHRL